MYTTRCWLSGVLLFKLVTITYVAAAEKIASPDGELTRQQVESSSTDILRLWNDLVGAERVTRAVADGAGGGDTPPKSRFMEWMRNVLHKVFKPAEERTQTQYGNNDDEESGGFGTGLFGRFFRWMMGFFIQNQEDTAGGSSGSSPGKGPGRGPGGSNQGRINPGKQDQGGNRRTTDVENVEETTTSDREGEDLDPTNNREYVSDDWEGK